MLQLIKKYFGGKSFRTGVVFTSGNFIAAFVGGISTLIIGRWIEPDVLGEFKKYAILTGYLGFGIIFVDAAFQRHFPYLLGKGETEKAKEIAGIVKWWYLMLVYSGTAIFSILAIRALIFGEKNDILGWLVQIPAYIAATYCLYLGILYRSNDDFLKLNKNILIASGVGLLTLPFVYLFKFTGLAIRTFLQTSIQTIAYHVNAPFKVKAKFDKAGLISLAKVSFPLQLPVYLDSHLLKASISLIILNTLGQQELGIFAMALLIQSFLLVFSSSLNQIITTKLMLKYGSNDSLTATFKYIIKPVILLTGVGILFVSLFFFTIGPIINNLLPKYTEAIIVTQVLSIELILALIRSPFTLFISSLMYKEMAMVRVLKVIITIILLLFFHSNIVEIAVVTIIANFLNVIAGYVLLFFKMK